MKQRWAQGKMKAEGEGAMGQRSVWVRERPINFTVWLAPTTPYRAASVFAGVRANEPAGTGCAGGLGSSPM